MAFSVGLFFAICALVAAPVYCEKFCSVNTFENDENYMQFSKEANFEEYAVSGKFKDLHCCAKGYRSITWLKDGKPYPWSLQESSFILFPDSANQTIYAKVARQQDAGNYTCVLRNETVLHKHTIQLEVFEKVPDDAKLTYISQDSQVAVGDSLRLFCEAFLGQVDLPDAHSEAYWLKRDENKTLESLPANVQEEKIKREDNQTFGVYLFIDHVTEEDFGEYVCMIIKPGNVKPYYVTVIKRVEEQIRIPRDRYPMVVPLLLSTALLITLVALVVVYLKLRPVLMVHLKDSWSWWPFEQEPDDGKSCDVLLVYSQEDADLALGVLKENLERLKYTCMTKYLPDTFGTWYTTLRGDSQTCRRIIALLSPSLLNGAWDSNAILQAINQLKSLGPKLICITLKELPKSPTGEIKNAQGETLSKVMSTVAVLEWNRKSDDKFWYALRWRLPPKRGDNETRLNEDRAEDMA